jgi:hypothetical protein
MVLLAGTAAALLAAALGTTTTPIGQLTWGNELTLPSQRHVVRLAPPGRAPYLLAAIQRDGNDGLGLNFFRSDDGGATWVADQPIQPDTSERDEADLVVVRDDLAVVWSYESSTLAGSTRHDVWFQWWRLDGTTGRLAPDPAIRVFDATTSSQAYSRAQLAVDGAGRLWVMAFRLESGGGSTAVISVSTDGGLTFTAQPPLDTLPARGGGVLLATGGKLLALYDCHDAGTPSRYRVRSDGDPLPAWSASSVAFPEGIYHGAALSAVDDGAGGAHVVYKSEDAQLWYRTFDGAGFSPAQRLESTGDWALQPATTRIGGTFLVFYDQVIQPGTQNRLVLRIGTGGALSDAVVVDGSTSFKSYPAAPATLPDGTPLAVVLYASQPADGIRGPLVATTVPWPLGSTPPPPPPPPPPPDGALFADAFDRTQSGLGASWSIRGGYDADGTAVCTVSGVCRATATGAPRCADCRVEALVRPGSAAEAGVFVRGDAASSDRYDAIVLADGRLQLRRLNAGVPTVLASGPSGIADRGVFTKVSLSASGTDPVELTAGVGGVDLLSATDASAARVVASAFGGLWTYTLGVRFDEFAVFPLSAAPPPPPTPPPPPPPGPGTLLFADAFDRVQDGLGADWAIRGAWRADGQAVSVGIDTPDRATATGAPACGDCTVTARVQPGAAMEAGVFLRGAAATSDRYDLIVLRDGRLQLRRLVAGKPTVLAEVASGIADRTSFVTVALSASGAGPVVLTGALGGVAVLTATDPGAGALGGAGAAGLWTYTAGVRFDEFEVRAGP